MDHVESLRFWWNFYGVLGAEPLGERVARNGVRARGRLSPSTFLAFCYDLAAYLRGMDFLVFPYNAVLNAGVFDDAVVADGDIGADGAVLDDYVLADVARGNQLDVVHGLVLTDDVANVVEMGPVLQ